VPLSADWNNFVSLPDNKADLARYLSGEIIKHPEHSKTIIVAAQVEVAVHYSNSDVDTSHLQARQEEACTRLIVHCVQNTQRTL
jgi:hypothetical protein